VDTLKQLKRRKPSGDFFDWFEEAAQKPTSFPIFPPRSLPERCSGRVGRLC